MKKYEMDKLRELAYDIRGDDSITSTAVVWRIIKLLDTFEVEQELHKCSICGAPTKMVGKEEAWTCACDLLGEKNEKV